jgi:hypothetical protein
MNRLQAELRRLYLPLHDDAQATRTLVLELGRPASWEELAKVWQGVQADLEWPAPAIAVSGVDSYQLWFSLARPMPVEAGMELLDLLRRRYLPEVAMHRIELKHAVDALPPLERAPGRWSAFVTSDLAALFADEPSLDLPPSPDAQADLLSRLQSVKADAVQRAVAALQPAPAATPAPAPAGTPARDTGGGGDPRSFLLQVMNDGSVDLQLRIEAAKALLPYFEGRRAP